MNDKCGKYRILSFLVLLVTIFVMVLAAAYLPQDWYAFKYFVVTCAGVLASLLFSLVAVSESAASSSEETAVSEPEPEVTFESAMAELNQLIGLKEIKDAVKDFADVVRIQLIANNGDRTSLPKYHFVLEGNPGTGKTTVAKILAKIFYAIGLLPTSKCVEVTRRGLVGEYIGHTAPLVKKKCDEAMGGVLFIDEAYPLISGGENDFGQQVDFMLKAISEQIINDAIANYSKVVEAEKRKPDLFN